MLIVARRTGRALRAMVARRPVLTGLALFAVLVCIRVPAILVHGRFWAEEGTVFYHNAAVMPPWTALFHPFAGYLNLATNAATLAAWLCAPVRYAPYVTTLIGLGVQLLPAWLILTARDAWLRPAWVRYAALAAILFVPSSSEIWMQSLHIQIELALCCGLILALDTAGGALRPAILIMAPLAGPGSAVFAPLFLLRGLMDRDPRRLRDAVLLACASALQLGLFYSHQAQRNVAPWFGPAIVAVFCREPLELVIGTYDMRLEPLIQGLHARMVAHPYGLSWTQPALIAFFAPFAVAGVVWRDARVCLWLLAGNAAFTGAATFGALGGAASMIYRLGSERYILVGQTLCELMVLAFAVTVRPRALRLSAGLLFAVMLWHGEQQYWHRNYVQGGDHPLWSQEVRAWRADHTRALRVWPSPWIMTLP